ncbi:hypothetical protein HNR01_001784 [Methylorubrum rhodesianum]|uniref:hypothetical protein n=1 Tax=Methylorubrum rhodesianum TaxID=29427 RepID=UPI0016104B2A|nr:hypothetical protein [Methylorubrum rhodesianum]MBB5762164.1 hypothetical protein [Methylorubrum rhodesianum]
MADDVLKSFVVSLGWKVDREGERRVSEAIGSVTKQAALLATALGAAALAATAAVAKIAAQFDNLYFVSQRTGATVQNIKGLAYAFGQVGGSGAGAVSAIESFSRSMRTNPGIRQFVRDLGVATEAGGKTRDSVDVLTDAIDAIQKKHPYYVGAQMAALLGIDEQTFNTLSSYRKEIKEFRAEYERTARTVGLNNDAAAASSNKFMTALRGLQASAQAVAEKILTDLSPVLTKFLEDIRSWIEKNPETITKAIEAIIAAAIALVTAFTDIVKALTPVAQGFQSMAEHLTGKEGLQAAMEAFAVFLVGSWLVRILGAFGKVKLGWIALLAGIGMDVYKNSTAEGRADTIREGEEAINREQGASRGGFVGGLRDAWRRRPTWLGGSPEKTSLNAETGIARRARRAAEADKTNYNFTGDNAAALKQAAKELGTSPEDLATVISYETGGRFSPSIYGGKGGRYMGLIQFGPSERAQFGANDKQTFKEQLPAVVRYLKTRGFKPGMGLLDLYSTINAGTPGRYNASDGNGTVRSHVENMRRTHGARARRFLESGAQPELTAPPPKAPAFPRMNMSPGGFDVNALTGAPPMGANTNNLSTNNVKLEHKTEIRVDGTGDPASVANRVERAQTRVADLSLRNAQTAIR